MPDLCGLPTSLQQLPPGLDVELDVLLGAPVDTEPGERPFERRHHAVARDMPVPPRRAEDAGDVPALRLVEAEALARRSGRKVSLEDVFNIGKAGDIDAGAGKGQG